MNICLRKHLKALSAPVRRDILNLLKKGRMSAGDIAAQFDMTQATVSYHLSILKSADLVREEKDKNYIYYEINATVFEEMLLYFKSFLGGNNDVEE